jgi:hypothetical protein
LVSQIFMVKVYFQVNLLRRVTLIAKVHNGIQIDPENVKYMPTQYGRFYNHDEKGFNTRNEVIGNHRYLRALKNIPANAELTANYMDNPEMEQPQNFGSGKYASFDFDKTIATDDGLAKARQMIRDGYNLFIVSARDKVTPDMVARARKAGIPEENIIATGSDEAKVRKVKQLGVEKHFDDKPEVIAALGLVGEQFKKGGGVKSKRYTKSLTGTNKLFTKNNLFKKKSTKRIYDPNAKYYAEGGESGCPDGFEEDPQTGECIPIREKVEDIQEMPRPIVQKPPYYQESFVNPAAYVSGYGGGDPGMYKYGFLDSEEGQIIGGGGFGFPKLGVHLNASGVLPMSADDRQYFKGAYEAGISKDIKNLNLGLGVGTAITGYPGENGFVRDPIKLQPKLNLKYNFEDGGDISIATLNRFVRGGTAEECEEGYKWDETQGQCVPLIDVDWMENWYANRTLPLEEIPNKKYVNLMKKRLPQYNPDSTLLEELANTPPVEYQDVIADNPNVEGEVTYDKNWNPDKILLKRSLLNNPVKLNQVYNQERSTAVDVDVPGLFDAQNMVIDPGLVMFKDRWGDLEGADRDAAEDNYNYLTDPQQDNIHSLIFEERYKRDLKPNQVITEEDINNWRTEAEASGALDRSSPNFDDTLYTLFKLAKDNKALMKWFNQLASNDAPVDENAPQYTKHNLPTNHPFYV